MRTLLVTGLLSATTLAACQPQQTPRAEVATPPVESPAHATHPHVTEAITALGTATVARESAHTDAEGMAAEPFTGATVLFTTSRTMPKNGSTVFMWPLRNAPKPMNVKITKVEGGNACNGSNEKMFAVTGTPEAMAEILAVKPDAGKSAEFPFEMAYIIPTQPNAKLVQPPATLPPGITTATVKFALDLNNDGQADAVYVTSDCDSGGAVKDDTGAVCTASYLMKEGKWVLLDSTSPC